MPSSNNNVPLACLAQNSNMPWACLAQNSKSYELVSLGFWERFITPTIKKAPKENGDCKNGAPTKAYAEKGRTAKFTEVKNIIGTGTGSSKAHTLAASKVSKAEGATDMWRVLKTLASSPEMAKEFLRKFHMAEVIKHCALNSLAFLTINNLTVAQYKVRFLSFHLGLG